MINIETLLNQMINIPNIKSDIYFNSKGIAVPRVTEILSATMHSDSLMYWSNSLGLKGIHYKAFMNNASSIGTEAHHHIEQFLTKKLECNDNIPFLGFLLWYNNLIDSGNVVKTIGTEEKITCDWFGGTYDALIEINDKLYLVDFKTSNHVTEKYFLQLAAYTYILEDMGYHIDGHIILQLDKENPGFNEYILLMDIIEHYVFMQNCKTAFLSLVYAYYNTLSIREGFKEIF